MEWKEVKIGDLGQIITGKTPKTAIRENWGGKIPFLSPSDDMSNKTSPVTARTLTELGVAEVAKCLIPANSICVSCIGSDLGKVVKTDRELVTNQQINTIVPHSNVDSDFVYYLMCIVGKELNYISKTSTAVPIINKSTFSDWNIVIPEKVDDQRRIASILSSLDRKIELNNKINANLEEMAQAIFKNWFVDFEPFKDGKFVDSELGMIPEGWEVGSYSEMIDSLISGDWGKENPQGNYTHEVACVRGCDFQDINNGVRGKTPQRYILEKNYQAKHLKDKDILVEISGGTATVSTGRTSLVTEELLKKYKHDIVCTNFCKVLRPLSQFSSYVYYSWKYKYDNDIMFGYENGTSGIKNFAIKDFIEKESVLIPKEQDIVEFQKIIDNLQKQKQIKGTENTTLSTLRDTLLPRLMSGEIEVPE